MSNTTSQSDRMPREGDYQKHKMFHASERIAYWCLKRIAGRKGYVVFAMVNMHDLVQVNPNLSGEEQKILENKISQKRVDFVLCDSKKLQVRYVIELDGWNHVTCKETQESDEFKNQVFKSVGIELIRIPYQFEWDVELGSRDNLNILTTVLEQEISEKTFFLRSADEFLAADSEEDK